MKHTFFRHKEPRMKLLFIMQFCVLLSFLSLPLALKSETAWAGEIHDAIEKGDLNRIEELTAKNPEVVNEKDENDFTPLHRAAYSGNLYIVKFLVEKGADVNAVDKFGFNPTYGAILMAHQDIFLYLRKKGAKITNLNFRVIKDMTQLTLAMRQNRRKTAKELILAGVDVNIKDERGRSALFYAVFRGEIGMVKLLLSKGAEVRTRDIINATPLHYACSIASWQHKNEDKMQMIKLFLLYGADVNADAYFDNPYTDMVSCGTPLHWAAESGSLEASRLLIEHGAEVNKRDILMRTPLHNAARINNPELVIYLLLKGAKPEAQDSDRHTPLHIAVKYGANDVALFLISKGGNVNAADKSGITALHGKYRTYSEPEFWNYPTSEETILLKALIAKGADPNKTDCQGRTPLHYAVDRKANRESLELLIEAGADVNKADNEGKTPLHYAAEHMKTEDQ